MKRNRSSTERSIDLVESDYEVDSDRSEELFLHRLKMEAYMAKGKDGTKGESTVEGEADKTTQGGKKKKRERPGYKSRSMGSICVLSLPTKLYAPFL